MKATDEINELAAALAKAQGELGGAKKDSTNPHYKSKYADLASVVDALKACFPKHGLSYVQTIVTGPEGVGVETRLLHASGQWIEGEPFALPVNKADAQGFGSCLTYARRYSLAAIAGVAPEDDDGQAAVAARPTGKQTMPGAMSAGEVAKEEYDAMSPEVRAVVDEWAANVTALVDEGRAEEANAFLHKNCETQEDKLAIWAVLGSKTRSALKKAAQPALATQG